MTPVLVVLQVMIFTKEPVAVYELKIFPNANFTLFKDNKEIIYTCNIYYKIIVFIKFLYLELT